MLDCSEQEREYGSIQGDFVIDFQNPPQWRVPKTHSGHHGRMVMHLFPPVQMWTHFQLSLDRRTDCWHLS